MNSFQNYGSYHPVNNTGTDPTHEYIDCEIINNSTTDLSPVQVVFNQVKTSQIVDTCNEYYLSVVRWSLDSGLPQIVPQMEIDIGGTNTNINQTAYKLNIGFDNFTPGTGPGTVTTNSNINIIDTIASSVFFIPEDLTVTAPLYQPTSPDEVNTNPYYFVHSIGHFLNMVNNALSDAYAKLKTYVLTKTALATYVPIAPPHFDWNGSVLNCNMDSRWIYKTGQTTPRFFITMNTPLFNLFNTFPSKYLNKSVTPGSTNGANYALMFYNFQWEDTYSAGDPLVDYYIYNQEGSSVPSWSPVNSIVFQSSTIPVNPSNTGAPNYTGENLKDSIQASGISSVLTDFEIPLDRGDEYTNAILYYTPSSEYRLFDLVSNGGLLNLNIQIFWKDKLGFIHPFLLKNGASGSLKLLLRKKSFNGLQN